MEPIAIQLEALSISFRTFRGKVDVLQGIDLRIEPGELFVLLGPSGCGKSTLLNLVAGLEKPTGGTIRIGNKVVADPANKIFLLPFERDVSMVFQSYALYPHMTVEQNIGFPLTNLKQRPSVEEIRRKVGEAAALLRIEELLDRKPVELSGGQRQRVAIGRAIVREPRVFLMDEPLSNLDAQLRMDMRAQLRALQQKLGVTSIYVTHDQTEAMTLGDRIAVLNDGVIQQLGTPAEIYDRPVNTFVARFVGSPPMNLFTGKVVGEGDAVRLQTPALLIDLPPELAAKLQKRDSEATIGIRPEHLELAPAGKGNLEADVDVVENLGSEYMLHIFTESGQIVVRTPRKPESRKVALSFAAQRVHVFDRP